MTNTWHLTYVDHHTNHHIDLGIVNADWLTAFSQRHFDKGAEFRPGVPPLPHQLVIQWSEQEPKAPTRYYLIQHPNKVRGGR